MTGHLLAVLIAVAMVVGPFLFALNGSRSNYARQVDEQREKTRDALARSERHRLGTVR